MSGVPEHFPYVMGVDTHARTHTYCLIDTATGVVVDTAVFPASSAGIRRAIAWALRRTEGRDVFAAVEGTSSYGATLTAALAEAGIPVGEMRPGPKSSHAHHGKSDALDAESAARMAMTRQLDHIPQPRATGQRTVLRTLLSARKLLDHQRTANRNALLALLRSVDLGIDARKSLSQALVRQLAATRPDPRDPLYLCRREVRRLARTVLEQEELLKENSHDLEQIIEQLAPGLQDIPGLGPVTAAILVCAYSHHGRLRDEAAFASLAGASPLPASSGNTQRHRLNRSGDRQLNRALDTIVRTRLSFDPATRDYMARATAAGKTRREARRNLKRYVARSIFRQLRTMPALT